MKLGLREANQQFARVIRAVRAGREVVLTDRGRSLAIIRPMPVDDAEARLTDLAAEGLVRPATRSGPMPRWRPVHSDGELIAETIRRDRDETV